MKETDLAQKFINYLSCYDLYFEVASGGGCVDIVAITPHKLMIAYEVKTSLNFRVIEQAFFNRPFFHLSYIAVPYSRGTRFQEMICRNYGIGVLQYNPSAWNGPVVELVKPTFNRKASIKSTRLHEYQKRSIAGTASNGGRVTPFKITVENMITYVKRHPGCSMKQMFSEISHHYHSDAGAISSTYQWMRQGVIKDVVLKNGKLFLSEVIE